MPATKLIVQMVTNYLLDLKGVFGALLLVTFKTMERRKSGGEYTIQLEGGEVMVYFYIASREPYKKWLRGNRFCKLLFYMGNVCNYWLRYPFREW